MLLLVLNQAGGEMRTGVGCSQLTLLPAVMRPLWMHCSLCDIGESGRETISNNKGHVAGDMRVIAAAVEAAPGLT